VINNHYQLYINATLALARTCAIKLHGIALAINDRQRQLYPSTAVDTEHLETWKYYLNMAGLYHDTDQAMTVVSLDTLQTISFDKASLDAHPQTQKAYQYGSRYYDELLTRYPDQGMLILGVLYAPNDPAFLQSAIDAPEATLLYYPAQYIEPYEYDLKDKLQAWLYNYQSTWVNRAYEITDNLYCATVLAQITLYMVPALINLRLAACKTPQAHTYHIREYLASNAGLDRYMEQLTRKQALFLYRNLPYIRTNAGRKEVFTWLVDELLTQRNLPLYEYVIKHNTYVQLPDNEHPTRLSYTPDLYVKRNALNYNDVNQIKQLKTFEQIREQMDTSAPGNFIDRTEIHPQAAQEFVTHRSSVIATKLVESLAVDISDEVPHTLTEVLMTHWMAWACQGRYAAHIPLEINGEINAVTLSTKDCVVLYQYCLDKALGIGNTYIQKLLLQRVVRLPKPSLEELQTKALGAPLTTSAIQTLSGYVPSVGQLFSVDSFYDAAAAVFAGGVYQYRYYSNIPHILKNAAAQAVSTAHYSDYVTEIYPQKTYAQWVEDNNLSFDGYTPQDYLALAAAVFDQATGLSAHAALSIKEVQRAMLAVISRLTSYSIQYLSDVDSSKVKLVNHPLLGLTAPDSLPSNEQFTRVSKQDILAIGRSETQGVGSHRMHVSQDGTVSLATHRVQGLYTNPTVSARKVTLPKAVYTPRPIQTLMTSDSALTTYNLLSTAQKMVFADL
jgi:hypothetical protein